MRKDEVVCLAAMITLYLYQNRNVPTLSVIAIDPICFPSAASAATACSAVANVRNAHLEWGNTRSCRVGT